jgi:PS-10 peptidase S37
VGRAALAAIAVTFAMLGAPAAAAAQSGDIADQLRAIPGMTLVEERPAPAPYRYFVLSYEQPADHRHPLEGTFQQVFTLLHKDTARPMVLHTSGYNVSLSPSRSETTRLVDGNQISVEQRFFTPSRPAPADWSDLNIWQAATDHHRLVAALDDLYPGRWLSTGASKGGMTSVYHRRFYPDDVDGTVAYVAPNDVVNAEDSAYTRFFERVGTPECRAALTALEREALGPRRAALAERFAATAAAEGWTFAHTIGTVDRALEMSVLDTAWAFWQYTGVANCANVPAASASTDDIYAFIDAVVFFGFYTDQGLEPYIPYYFQAGTQLGWPEPSFRHLRGLTRYPGLYEPRAVVPRSLPMRFE